MYGFEIEEIIYFGISDDENYFSMVNHYLGEGFLLNKWLLDIGAEVAVTDRVKKEQKNCALILLWEKLVFLK